MSNRREFASFATDEQLIAAAKACRAQGMILVDTYSPYPLHGIDPVLNIRRSRLPWVTFIGGVVGLSIALWFQYWSSSVSWPINVGGKPFDSLPAFVPVAFESLILVAGLATAGAFLLRCGLFPTKKARKMDARVTDDHFVLVVEHKDARMTGGRIDELWASHGALDTWSELSS